MHRPTLSVLALLAIGMGLTVPDRVEAGHPAVEKARTLLQAGDARAAVAALEAALPDAGADRGPIVVALRHAYAKAIDQAAKSGRADEADGFRENLLILNRRMRGAPEESPAGSPAKPADPFVAPVPEDDPPPAPVLTPTGPGSAAPRIEPTPEVRPAIEPPAPLPLEVPSVRPSPNPTPVPTAPVAPGPREADRVPSVPAGPTPDEILAAADYAYLAGRYLDANKSYALLDASGKLPAERRTHWAYCRSVDVVRRIKAKPATPAEWAAIDREIAEIKTLSPKYWYAEYLKNRAADRTKTTPRPSRGQVIRGAMPEGDPAPGPSKGRAPGPTGSKAGAARTRKPGDLAVARVVPETPPRVTTGDESAKWQVLETANFTIYHADPSLADAVGKAAEATRATQTRRWSGSDPPRAWAPRCQIYLYPTAAIFAQVTGQPAESPGFSTMDGNGAAIVGRRINLRADHPSLVQAILPHEVTHVILADLFPTRQIPRWADEGISVLSEPKAEQEKRIGDLDPALDGGKVFSIEHLMVRDYPEGKHWALYYAQSVSLTHFLVEQGSPGQFIEFLQGSQRDGVEAELRRVYRIDGFADLQARWLKYARAGATARLASREKGGRVTR